MPGVVSYVTPARISGHKARRGALAFEITPAGLQREAALPRPSLLSFSQPPGLSLPPTFLNPGRARRRGSRRCAPRAAVTPYVCISNVSCYCVFVAVNLHAAAHLSC